MEGVAPKGPVGEKGPLAPKPPVGPTGPAAPTPPARRPVELVDFLRARLDEEEQVARAAGGAWREHDGNWVSVDAPAEEGPARRVALVLHEGERAHIIRHDPARVLAEVEADRALLAEYEAVAEMDTEDAEPEFAYGRAVGLGIAVRYRALPYADHSDYREEWRP